MTGKAETFSSRWLMMLAMLGMAVGTGNIWRFPRIAAQNGGGEFLVAWVVFLVLWSIPLIMVEFGVGRKTRAGPVGAFLALMGPRWAWMGAWVAFVTVAIMFYYSVVTGWTLRYVVAAAAGEIPRAEPGAFWREYTASWWPVVTHGVAMGLGTWVIARGVRAIERVARVMMPTLLVLVVLLALRAVTLPGAGGGLSYLFSVDWAALGNARVWLEALTQNAWDTGAGWGLVLVYAAYLRQREDTALNAIILPTANNTVSLLSGIMVLCTVFAVVPRLVESLATHPDALAAYPALADAVRGGAALTPELIQRTIFSAGNEGLTFIWMPQLFDRIPLGQGFMVLFFLALAFAAFTSLISMIELGSRVLRDMGMAPERAVRLVGIAGFLLGLPSAVSLQVLHNQDWVWGVALMVSGLFFALAVIVSGVRRFRQEQLNHEHSDVRVGRWWDFVIGVVVPLEALALLVWWLYQARGWDPSGWLDPFRVENVGTILFQWGVVLLALLLANRWIARRTRVTPPAAPDRVGPPAVP
ncbi:MAG TPA: sodium-dependent transporter [Gemmatimonadales bacterium]|nr:sodium-dependent transporter [Gemmatimonadales bacterium]